MRLYLWDAGSLAAWKYYADPDTEDGMINGVREYLMGWLAEMEPTHAALCLDSPTSWRRERNPEYKAGRRTKPKPPHYVPQLRRLPDVAAELGIAVAGAAWCEADDVIATLANMHAGPDCEVIACSSDKDLLCLVGDDVRAYDPRPDKTGAARYYDAAAVEAKMGVPPHRIPDLLALMGDAADSIEGIEGFGRVRALTVLQQTRSMAEAFRLAAAGQLTGLGPRHQAALATGVSTFAAAMDLVRLKFDAPVTPYLDDLRVQPADAAVDL